MHGDFSKRLGWPANTPFWVPTCDCAKKKQEAEQKQSHAAFLADKTKKVFARLGFGDPAKMPEVKPLPGTWGDPLTAYKTGRNLILVGAIGSGKTTAIKAIAKKLTESLVPIRGGYVPSLMAKLKNMDDVSEVMASIQNGKVVVLDDLDKMLGTVYEIERLSLIVNDCVQKGKPLLVTTNLDFVALRRLLCSNKYGVPENWVDSFISRLEGGSQVVTFVGKDFRVRDEAQVVKV